MESSSRKRGAFFRWKSNFYDYIIGLYSDIADLRKKYYHEFKVTSHALVKDKTIDVIDFEMPVEYICERIERLVK